MALITPSSMENMMKYASMYKGQNKFKSYYLCLVRIELRTHVHYRPYIGTSIGFFSCTDLLRSVIIRDTVKYDGYIVNDSSAMVTC